MSVNLTKAEIEELQRKYSYLVNYESDEPSEAIDPLTYVDSNGDHLLHLAAQRGDLRTVELLIRAGLDVNRTGDMGCTALHYARMKKRDDVAEFLLGHGASESIRNDFGHLPGQSEDRK